MASQTAVNSVGGEHNGHTLKKSSSTSGIDNIEKMIRAQPTSQPHSAMKKIKNDINKIKQVGDGFLVSVRSS